MTTTKPFRVLAIGGVVVLGHPTVVLVARDGEAWAVQSLYNKGTMTPFSVGDVVNVPLQPCRVCRGTGRDPMSDITAWLPCGACRGKVAGNMADEDDWLRLSYECPRRLRDMPLSMARRAWADVPETPAC